MASFAEASRCSQGPVPEFQGRQSSGRWSEASASTTMYCARDALCGRTEVSGEQVNEEQKSKHNQFRNPSNPILIGLVFGGFRNILVVFESLFSRFVCLLEVGGCSDHATRVFARTPVC